MRGKTQCGRHAKKRPEQKIKWGKIIMVGIMAVAVIKMPLEAALNTERTATAKDCPEVEFVFARGSGGERWEDQNYLEFKSTIETKMATTTLTYDFVDLDYPAVGIGLDKLAVTLGAWVGSGEAYEFGESVNTGVNNLIQMVNGASCPDTKYVLGGYSQGAMVISKSLASLKADRVIYAATFGDPKLYLPEGEGIMPAACRGENLSDYRLYVPDCQAYKGLLGGYIPYEPADFTGKVGTWCDKKDVFCSSHLSLEDHLSYVADDLYEDASRVIFNKVTEAFNVENTVTSPHDTAILIDSTGSMSSMIEKYKAEALRLAEETLEAGGRVALYDYRDLKDPYTPKQHCDFSTCTMEVFQAALAKITPNGGGDEPESLLSASYHVMEELEWKRGSTKSLVILTDANFLSPDRDGMTYDEVVALSKKIDPVNFYIITKASNESAYTNLATATGGKTVTNFDELSLLTDFIMERFDSLPRVEECADTELEIAPTLEITEVTQLDDKSAKITFTTDGTGVIVILNEEILGVTNEKEIILTDLDKTRENVVTLVPISETIKGEGGNVKIELITEGYGGAVGAAYTKTGGEILPKEIVIKAPATGQR